MHLGTPYSFSSIPPGINFNSRSWSPLEFLAQNSIKGTCEASSEVSSGWCRASLLLSWAKSAFLASRHVLNALSNIASQPRSLLFRSNFSSVRPSEMDCPRASHVTCCVLATHYIAAPFLQGGNSKDWLWFRQFRRRRRQQKAFGRGLGLSITFHEPCAYVHANPTSNDRLP